MGRRASRRLSALGALAWLGLALACAGSGAGPQRLPGRDRVIVAPVNLAVKLPTELEGAVEPVRAEIIAYLQGRDARVAEVWPADAWDLWREAMLATAAERGAAELHLDAAVERFLADLSQHAEFGAFVLPTLVYRQARVWGQTARWDGVRRRISVRARFSADSRLPTVEPTGIGEAEIKGARVPGVSLQVLIFAPDGERVYEGWGGIDLAHAVQVTGSRATGHGRPVPRIDPFREPEHVREGVRIALDAYLPQRGR